MPESKNVSSVQDDIEWVNKNIEQLQEKYPNKYIVVKNEKVIVVADDFDTADKRATDLLGENIEFIVERIEVGDLFAYNFGIYFKDS